MNLQRGLYRGVKLDTINELNPHHRGNCFKREGELENITLNLVQDYFRYHLKLLRIENVKNWKNYNCMSFRQGNNDYQSRKRGDFTGKEYRKSNRLLNEKSPYLLQHAYNPVRLVSLGRRSF